MSRLTFALVDGRPPAAGAGTAARPRETAAVILPPLLFLALSLWLGVALPGVLSTALTGAVAQLFPSP